MFALTRETPFNGSIPVDSVVLVMSRAQAESLMYVAARDIVIPNAIRDTGAMFAHVRAMEVEDLLDVTWRALHAADIHASDPRQ